MKRWRPDGYETADDIVFSVGLDGSVTIDGKKQDSNTVVMKDKPGKSGILFSKTKVGRRVPSWLERNFP